MTEETAMTEEERNHLYRQMADSFIGIANHHAEQQNNKYMVGSAFLYGAARFSAFVTAVQAKELGKYDAEREEVVEYFISEFRRMLDENLDDYRRVFQPVETPKETVTKVHKYVPEKPAEPEQPLKYEHLVKK